MSEKSRARIQQPRWLRFSLRSMFLTLLAAALFFGLVSNRAQRQKRAAQEIAATGGWFKYDFQVANQPVPKAPLMLRTLLGKDYFAKLVHATIVADTPYVADAYALQRIEIVGKGVDESLLSSFLRLSDLRELHIRDGRITDKGVGEIAKLKQLEVLDLAGTLLEGTSLQSLNELPNLRELVLSHTKFDDAELQHLHGNDTITRLAMIDCELSGEGVDAIESFKALEQLELSPEAVAPSQRSAVRKLSQKDTFHVRGLPPEKMSGDEIDMIIKSIQPASVRAMPSKLIRTREEDEQQAVNLQ